MKVEILQDYKGSLHTRVSVIDRGTQFEPYVVVHDLNDDLKSWGWSLGYYSDLNDALMVFTKAVVENINYTVYNITKDEENEYYTAKEWNQEEE